MSFDGLHNICQIAVVIFAILVALASFGSNHFAKKVSNEKEQQSGQHINELVEGKNKLLSQNETLLERISEYKENLKKKDKKIDELMNLAKKDLYRPLSSVLRKQIIDNLKSQNRMDLKEIVVSDFNTNNNGKRIVSDIVSLLADAGINVKRGATGIAFGTSATRPQVKINRDSMLIAQSLFKTFSPYLKTKFQGLFDDSLDKGIVEIIIRGEPLFHADGSVEFQ